MIPGFSIISLMVAIATLGTPVAGMVENRPSDEWVVLELQTNAYEPQYMDYEVAKFPCSSREGQKFFGTIRPNGNLIITECVESQ